MKLRDIAACALLALCGWAAASFTPLVRASTDASRFNFVVTESIAGWRWPDRLSLADASNMMVDMFVYGAMEIPSQRAVEVFSKHLAPDAIGPGGGLMIPYLLDLNRSLTQKGRKYGGKYTNPRIFRSTFGLNYIHTASGRSLEVTEGTDILQSIQLNDQNKVARLEEWGLRRAKA
jgi:hypothetical protein